MSYREENYNDNKMLKLTGSQMNLTSRSDHSASRPSCNRIRRPCSAVTCCRKQISKTNDLRPRSAEYERKSFFCSINDNRHKCLGDSSLTLSRFTSSSSKLLQNLLTDGSSLSVPSFEVRSPDTDKLSQVSSNSKSECSVGDRKSEPGKSVDFPGEGHLRYLESEFQKLRSLRTNSNLEKAEVKSELPEVEEKTVRFYEGQPVNILPENKFTETDTFFKNSRSAYSCLKNNFKPYYQEAHVCQIFKKTSDVSKSLKLDSERTVNSLNDHNESDEPKTVNSDNDDQGGIFKDKERNEKENLQDRYRGFPKESCSGKTEETTEEPRTQLYLPVPQPDLEIINRNITPISFEDFTRLTDISSEETQNKVREENQIDKEGIKPGCCNQKIDSTYEEIVHLLQTLDEEDSDSVNLESKKESNVDNPDERVPAEEKIDYLTAVSSYLEELERDDVKLNENSTKAQNWNFTSPRLEDLLNKNSVELAHEVFTLKIQIEDQKKGIKLLKDTLEEQKEAKKILELEHQEALHKVSSEAETLVQRHQKFIKQLLGEKKNLNETVSKLVQDIKSGEERYKRNIKAMEEKHVIEIKRAKETQAAADKIKREKWMEIKTQKIKEMTVKGLEPELSRMALRQQEEMTELRNLQKAELEAVELRAARRTSELMDELRAELTKEKERAIAKETANLRASLEKEFEDERNKLQQHCQILKERNRKQEEKFSNQEFEFQQRLLDFRQEEDKKKQKIAREHEENLEEVRRQHLVELKNLKESLEAEKEIFINNYKKQQASKLIEREAELHQQYKKERDKEIELIIETLEKESSQVQMELNKACEGKLKRLKDKMEAEIKEIEASEEALKVKLSDTKSRLSEKEDCITELNSQIRQLQTELTFFRKSCEEMSLEKAKLKEVVRGEFENTISGLIKEKENLEKEIVNIKELHSKELAKKDQLNLQAKCEMQKELTRVYSRIKTAVSKKEKIIESLREENGAINQRCRELEFMLDQQRRNLLLQRK